MPFGPVAGIPQERNHLHKTWIQWPIAGMPACRLERPGIAIPLTIYNSERTEI